MSFFPAKMFLILYSLFIIKATISVRDLDALFLPSTQVVFNLSTYQCNSAEIICEFRVVQDKSVLRVTRIILNSKQLEGSLSPTIKRFTDLKELSVANNQLAGKIPSEIGDCRQLEVLNLRNNRFSGKIPPDFSSLVSLRSLDLSFNHFSGNLNFLKHLPNLENLHLSNNLFSGKIPVSLHILRHLRFLNLSQNSDLQSPVLDSLPRRYTLAKTKSSLTAYSPASSPLPTTFIHKKTHTSLIGWISGVFVGIGAGIIASLILAILFKLVLPCFKVPVHNLGVIVFSPLIKKAEDLVFLEQTQGLDSLQSIGRGGCGQVYKKELYETDGNGGSRMVIAIKQIVQHSVGLEELTEKDTKLLSRTMRQVRSEIKIIGRIRHRNLVPLLAHVPRLDCHLLVYEFMKNGSLHDCLKKASEGNEELIWNVRHKIALGAAKGLEYLHMNHRPQIIHRDLKPANILLDDDMEARIADFGLAAIIPDGHTHLTASNPAGTIGYIAPEYHQTLKFTDKCDIFSFGVVLIILVTGRFPSDDIFLNTDEYQVKWLRNAMLSDNPSRIIDPMLIGNGFEEEMLLVLKIAWFCTLDDPKKRPNSKEIRIMLEQVKQ